MKLTNIATAALLFAGSLQASIIANQASGFGLAAGPTTILQNFANPMIPTSPQASFSSATTGTLFSNLSVSSNTNLYYDPNGSGSSCSNGTSQSGSSPSLPTMVACVGNFNTGNATGWSGSSPHFQNQAQASNESTLAVQGGAAAFNPDVAINFGTQIFQASFLFAVPYAGQVTNTYEIQLFNAANQQIDIGLFKGTLGSSPYVQIQESQAFSEILITQLPSGGTTGYGAVEASGPTPTPGTYTFNALIGDVQASTVAPEPGTIGLLGLGLAGLGYVARRRKKA